MKFLNVLIKAGADDLDDDKLRFRCNYLQSKYWISTYNQQYKRGEIKKDINERHWSIFEKSFINFSTDIWIIFYTQNNWIKINMHIENYAWIVFMFIRCHGLLSYQAESMNNTGQHTFDQSPHQPIWPLLFHHCLKVFDWPLVLIKQISSCL